MYSLKIIPYHVILYTKKIYTIQIKNMSQDFKKVKSLIEEEIMIKVSLIDLVFDYH